MIIVYIFYGRIILKYPLVFLKNYILQTVLTSEKKNMHTHNFADDTTYYSYFLYNTHVNANRVTRFSSNKMHSTQKFDILKTCTKVIHVWSKWIQTTVGPSINHCQKCLKTEHRIYGWPPTNPEKASKKIQYMKFRKNGLKSGYK